MSALWIDRIAVILTIAFAAAWLGFHYRRTLRRRKENRGKLGACGSSCEGCPHGQNCGGKPQ